MRLAQFQFKSESRDRNDLLAIRIERLAAGAYYRLAQGNKDRRMGTLSLKVEDKLDREITRVSRRQGISKSELMRRAVHQYLGQQKGEKPFVSALELAGDLVGSIKGLPSDLSTNPKYMDDYGK